MDELKIRAAEEGDAAALLAIYAPYVRQTAVTFEVAVPTVAEFHSRICRIQEKYPYLVAELDGVIVGYAYAGAFKNRAAYDWAVELSVYVRMDCRRKKIGARLYGALEQLLSRQGILNLNACIAYASDPEEHLTNDSVRFHEREGYTLVGKFHRCGYKFNHWYDMVWMEKSIGAHLERQPRVKWWPEIAASCQFNGSFCER